MGREIQKRDVEESNRYCLRIGADIEEPKIGREEEIRVERQETSNDQKVSEDPLATVGSSYGFPA